MAPGAIAVEPDDLAPRVDPAGLGENSAGERDINGREHACIIEKPMRPSTIGVVPDDLAVRVDPEGLGFKSAGDIEGREGKRCGLGYVVPA
jgi:hypothetical protein